MDQLPERPRFNHLEAGGRNRYSWWWVVSVLAVGLILGLGSLALIQLVARPLAIVILAVAIATALSPLVRRLEGRLPRALAAILVYLGLFLIIIALGFLVFPTLIQQGGAFIAATPAYLEAIEGWIDQLGFIQLDEVTNTVFDQIGLIAAALLFVPMNIASALFDLLLILFIALYWIILMPKMKAFFLSLFAIPDRSRIAMVLSRMGEAMGGYIRGTAIDGFIVALLTYIGLTIIGVPYALVLSIIAGFLEIIPIAGPIIGGTLIVATALAHDPGIALITLIFVLVLQQVESNILVPNIMRAQTETSPLLVLIAILIGSTIGGLMGALVAIPTAAALRVLVKFVLAPAVRKSNHAPLLESDELIDSEIPQARVYPEEPVREKAENQDQE